MPDALPTPHVIARVDERDVDRPGPHPHAGMLEDHGLAVALDLVTQALNGVAALVRRVPVSGPVGDDRGIIAERDVEMDEALALALWWNSPAGCEALGRLPGGGIVEHGRWRRVPAALRHAVTLITEVEQQGFCAVTLWRRAGTGSLTAREKLLLERLAPHVATAIAGELRRAGEALRAEMLEGLGQGVLILDADGRVVSASQGLRAMLAGSDGLRLTERGLVAANSEDQARLDGLIRAALRPLDGIARDGRMAIARPEGGTSWRLEARVLRPNGLAGVALILDEPRRRVAPPESWLRDTLA